MNLASQLQTRYEWTPNYRQVFKKPVPPGLKTFQVPQTTGISGWIVLTYDKDVPVCLWLTTQECRKLPLIVDERLCGDTFFRAEKIGKDEFVISDIWMYNSNCVAACSTFKQRYDWLKKLLDRFTFYIPGTPKLIHKSDLSSSTKIKGYEEHPEENIGKPGYFVEKDDSETFTVNRLPIPDCYEIPGKGYLHVPDLKTSVYLRSKGSTFTCKCVPHEDEFWAITENIPEVEVNAS